MCGHRFQSGTVASCSGIIHSTCQALEREILAPRKEGIPNGVAYARNTLPQEIMIVVSSQAQGTVQECGRGDLGIE